MHLLTKARRFTWRAARNLVCAAPSGARLLFPAAKLAGNFGRGDAEYAVRVFLHHHLPLEASGFDRARSLLEIGPGRNLGTALLWWAVLQTRGEDAVRITLWDVHPNAQPEEPGFWANWASRLLDAMRAEASVGNQFGRPSLDLLERVASSGLQPDIRYLVCPLERMESTLDPGSFELVYSHAALEHVRSIERFWLVAGRLTAPGGWHSHRIDLADHGLRDTNYIEMLEWSHFGWWLTTRFLPGAINRWRAGEHEVAVQGAGLSIVQARREVRPQLPVPREYLAAPYRGLEETELRTTALDLIARRQ